MKYRIAGHFCQSKLDKVIRISFRDSNYERGSDYTQVGLCFLLFPSLVAYKYIAQSPATSTLLQGLIVSGVSDKTVARQSGLKVNDVIQMYALATQSDIERIQTTSTDVALYRALKYASTTGKSVVLVIMRRTQKTTTL